MILTSQDQTLEQPRHLRLESVKQTEISVFGAIQRRICIIGEDFSPSLGIHEHGEVVSCISIAYVTLCYICICQSCDFCCIVINLGRHTNIHKCKRICELLVWGRFIVILKKKTFTKRNLNVKRN